ncbi:MAG: hypothetical protein LKG11_06395 [Bacilli bacterium]|jgi:hypothetical protein|nr:hypothetical protein [Bacilli bacterium]
MESKNDYDPFIQNFIFMAYQCYKRINGTFLVFDGKSFKGRGRVAYALGNAMLSLSKKELSRMLWIYR